MSEDCPMCDGQDIDCPVCAAQTAREAEAKTVAPSDPEAPAVRQRVSELKLNALADKKYQKGLIIDLAADLRLARARIAELESELDHYEDWCSERHAEGFQRGEEVGRDDAQKEITAANARADRLEAQLQAVRAAGTREDGLREAAEIADAKRREIHLTGAWAEGMRDMGVRVANAIRARLTPAEPTADTGEKG